MTTLSIRNREVGDVTILDLVGEISLGGGNVELRAGLRQTLVEGKENILLNLEKVSYIDSSGLGELIAGYVALQKNGGTLKLLRLNAKVQELMMITKLLTVFEVYESEEEAVSSFQIHSERGIAQSEIPTGKLRAAASSV
jgi:anti-sigma B factor antagonist